MIKVKIKTHIDITGKIVPAYMREGVFIVVDYPSENETTLIYDDFHVYTFNNKDIVKV